MSTRSLLGLLLLVMGCSRPARPASAAPSVEIDPACREIKLLSQVMDCELSPYLSGRTGDEAAFRRALTQLADLAPSDPAFHSAPGWPALVNQMLQTRDYAQGCTACHSAYRGPYRRGGYASVEIPWTDVHAAPATAPPAAPR